MHDIRYDAVHDEIVVGNPFAQAILTFRGGASGNEKPVRVIQGPKTQLGMPDRIAVDAVNNEIYVPDGDNILVFPRDGNGDVAPIRILSAEGWDASGIDVDPIHNAIVVSGSYKEPGGKRRNALLIFNRTAQGKAQPTAIISGPRTGLIQTRQIDVFPEKGLIIVSQITSGSIAEPENTFIGAWSINDKGDVPPRWKIAGNAKNVMKKPRGVVVNPKHKEVIVSDMRLNAVLTYAVPEMF
jgi:DNA-binding beta-propeller fold protein YncE